MRPRGSTRAELSGGPLLRLHATRGDFSGFDGTRFHLSEWHGEDLKVGVFDLVAHDRSEVVPQNAGFNLADHGTQELFDDLWRLGFRPTAPRGDNEGRAEAMQAHIEDLRKVAFKQLHIGE